MKKYEISLEKFGYVFEMLINADSKEEAYYKALEIWYDEFNDAEYEEVLIYKCKEVC